MWHQHSPVHPVSCLVSKTHPPIRKGIANKGTIKEIKATRCVQHGEVASVGQHEPREEAAGSVVGCTVK